MDFLEKYNKPRDTKRAHILTTTAIFKTTPVHNYKSKECTRIFKLKIFQELDEKFACPFCGSLKW